MRKLHKNKKGFTLVEMVLVVAIIVILAGVLTLNVTAIVQNAKAASAAATASNDQYKAAVSESEVRLAGYGF